MPCEGENGQSVAERNTTVGVAGSTFYFLDPDPLGTATAEVRATDGQVTRRYQDPFGVPRGPAVTWSSARGYLNAPVSSFSGLTQLGARAYDPTLGRFLSVDPLLDVIDPGSLAAYAYANNSPVTLSDPSGLSPMEYDAPRSSDSKYAKLPRWDAIVRPQSREPTSDYDRSARHDAAGDEAIWELIEQNGPIAQNFLRDVPIPNASKECLYYARNCDRDGFADLVYVDHGDPENDEGNIYYVWEVKSANYDGDRDNRAIQASGEAVWYVYKLQATGSDAALGESFARGEPGLSSLYDHVWTPESGAILYGRDEPDSWESEIGSQGDATAEQSSSFWTKLRDASLDALSSGGVTSVGPWAAVRIPLVPVPGRVTIAATSPEDGVEHPRRRCLH